MAWWYKAPLTGIVIRKCVFFYFANKDIILCWVPCHIGIKDNEKADAAANCFGFASCQGTL